MSRQRNSDHTVKVPQLAWWDEFEAELSFPENWQVTACRMPGHDAPKLDETGFRQAFANPIGTRPIRELARGKKNVVIVFDDMSRPTKIAEIVPFVLEELTEAGVAEENIQFICALGTHGALTAAGIASLIAGALVLFNTDEAAEYARISLPVVVVIAACFAGTFFFIMTKAIRNVIG